MSVFEWVETFCHCPVATHYGGGEEVKFKSLSPLSLLTGAPAETPAFL